jgi:AAA family ATP:ADP antiporter
MSAERDNSGREYLASEKWQRMDTGNSFSSRALRYFDNLRRNVTGDLDGDDLLKVLWLSATLFFVVGGYWLLRSLKDPIISVIDGVEYIPSAKIASLFVVFALVIVYNKLLDIFPKHHLFYMMGIGYGGLFALMGLLLMHPTIGLSNTKADPYRWLGWVSYITIESFGSMVVQSYWALVNASVDVNFAKKNFGLVVAGAQIGSILGPSLATQADTIGIPLLYMTGAAIMFFMVAAMKAYIDRFGAPEEKKIVKDQKKSGKEEGIMEGFYLFWEHDYVKGIFVVSSLYMIQVTIVDYMMKVLAKDRYEALYPDDPQAALRNFASFMGFFGQTTNLISFLFSLFGTGMIIQRYGLQITLISFPALLLLCAVVVYISPTIWVVFAVMMIMKGMSYALNNPTKEILYQQTSTGIKFKCKSWIDTFGQRSAKAAGSLVTNAFASSMVDLVAYGSIVGVVGSAFLIWVSYYMGKEFEELSAAGIKVGEAIEHVQVHSEIELGSQQNDDEDTSCGVAEEGQDATETLSPEEVSIKSRLNNKLPADDV